MMSFLYSTGIAFYTLMIRFAALFNTKAATWVKGRKGWKKELSEAFKQGEQVLWFHAASLGEFEQGRPLIEAIRQNSPEIKILLTFFSPSGYLQQKDYSGADKVMYLPSDCPGNASFFVRTLRPAMAVFIKYEFWFNYMSALNKHDVPVFYISVLFRKEQVFFKWYGGWFRKGLLGVTHFFVQDQASADMLLQIDIDKVTVSGDTRFDRVADILTQKNENPDIKKFCEGHKVLVMGSTWPQDEEILSTIPKAFPDLKLIIAPHEVKEERVTQLISTMGVGVARYTRDDPAGWQDKKILVIDTIGVLSSIYRYAHVAYIGGAFGSGLHNIQEPAVNGIPVIFGPHYKKFREAVDLVGLGAAFTVSSKQALEDALGRLLEDESLYQSASETSRKYMLDHTGATEKIMDGLSDYL
jgi:3-deoxy-D-manno-octulosonic-acid transferase